MSFAGAGLRSAWVTCLGPFPFDEVAETIAESPFGTGPSHLDPFPSRVRHSNEFSYCSHPSSPFSVRISPGDRNAGSSHDPNTRLQCEAPPITSLDVIDWR